MLRRNAATVLFGVMVFSAGATQPPESPVTTNVNVVAINILLEPAQNMSRQAQQLNRQLRENHPQGYALDATHVPHISLLQIYVRTADLPKVFMAVGHLVQKYPLIGTKLTANGFDQTPWEGLELVSLRVQNTSDLTAAQSELIAALRSYSVGAADAHAFVTTPDAPQIDAATIEYVRTFIEKRTGKHFRPHLTVGLTDQDFADHLQSLPTAPVEFKIDEVGVYQLGNVGAARKALWSSAHP